MFKAVHTGHRHDVLYIGILIDLISIRIIKRNIDALKFRHCPGGRIPGILACIGIIFPHDSAGTYSQLFCHCQRRGPCEIINFGNVLLILSHEIPIYFSRVGVKHIALIRIIRIEIGKIQLVSCRMKRSRILTAVDIQKARVGVGKPGCCIRIRIRCDPVFRRFLCFRRCRQNAHMPGNGTYKYAGCRKH